MQKIIMFIRLTKYQLKRLLHDKETMFWTLCFPIVLGTLFYIAFGNMMQDNEIMKNIPVAVVEGKAGNENFKTVIDELSDGKEDEVFAVQAVSEKEAKKLLFEEKIVGYYLLDTEVSLKVSDSGIKQTICKQVLDEYNRMTGIVSDIVMQNPALLNDSGAVAKQIEEIVSGTEYTKEITYGSGKVDTTIGFFYALIAMVCIYGCLMGIEIVKELEADISPIGARRMVAPTSKMMQLMSDITASFLLHITEIFVVICYIRYLLKVDFGDRLGLIIVACVFGSMIGILMGVFVATLIRARESVRFGVVIAISMILSFLSGLMSTDIPHLIEKYAPIVNRLNPCMMLVNSLYSLHIYETMGKYISCLVSMAVMTVLLFIASILMMRRRKYASL